VKISALIDALEQFAPLPLQESYDNAGLQLGLTETEVSGALLCLDVTEAVVDEAVRKGCNLIVAHHPLVFHALKRIADEDYVQRTVRKAIINGITIVAMHTNLDNARGGVNFKIAEKMGLMDVDFASVTQVVNGVEGGSLVIGRLEKPMAADDFVIMLKQVFEAESIRCNELLRRPIERVAICGGAGSFMINDAVKAGADAFVTGEASYHEMFGLEQQIQLAVMGHYESEHFTIELLEEIIKEKCPDVKCLKTEVNTNPTLYI
jgi:dinuclear metal center YbgI/SA1388 family protein